tara:strand:- start:2623 stop:3486 length:864 start_codon:yes stop_codon:yes gene_type:complete
MIELMNVTDWIATATSFELMNREQINNDSQIIQDWRKGNGSKKDGEAAIKRVVEGNLRLVVSMWKKYFLDKGLARPHSLEILQEGAIGLCEGVIKFDPSLGFKFSTYVAWYILKNMREYQRDSERPIRFKGERHWQAIKACRLLADKQITNEEIEKAINLPIEKCRQLAMDFSLSSWLYSIDTWAFESNDGDKRNTQRQEAFIAALMVEEPPIKSEIDEVLSDLFDEFNVLPRLADVMICRFEDCRYNKKTTAATANEYKEAREKISEMREVVLKQNRTLEYTALSP